MSKSDPSDLARINMTDDHDAIANKFRKAKSDPDALPGHVDELEGRPEARNLLGIYTALSGEELVTVLDRFAGAQFSQLKNELTELTIAKLSPITEEAARLMADPGEIDKVLEDGAARARAIADPIMTDVRRIVGFV